MDAPWIKTLYMSKFPPVTGREADGSFRLELPLVDNLGKNPWTGKEEKEAYEVRWSGPAAEAFWTAHRADLVSGAILRTQLQRLRARVKPNFFPPQADITARAIDVEIIPKRTHHPAAAAA